MIAAASVAVPHEEADTSGRAFPAQAMLCHSAITFKVE
jgi:hypothetical protein